MKVQQKEKIILRLTEEDLFKLRTLDLEVMAIAILILQYEAMTGVPLQNDAYAAKKINVHGRTWRRISKSLLDVFSVNKGYFSFRNFSDQIEEKKIQEQTQSHSQKTRRMNEKNQSSSPSNTQTNLNPNTKITDLFGNPEAIKTSSPKKIAIAQGIELLTSSGKTEYNARACIGRLFKDYSDETILKIIHTTIKKYNTDGIADPYSYIVKSLKNEGKKSPGGPYYQNKGPREVKHIPVSSKASQVSKTTIEMMKKKATLINATI